MYRALDVVLQALLHCVLSFYSFWHTRLHILHTCAIHLASDGDSNSMTSYGFTQESQQPISGLLPVPL